MEPKDKEAFIAQYHGQDVARVNEDDWGFHKTKITVGSLNTINYLELKSLEDISDEHLKILTEIINTRVFSVDSNLPVSYSENTVKENISILAYTNSNTADFLRANGYLLDWTNKKGRTYTTKELLEDGVVKLKSK